MFRYNPTANYQANGGRYLQILSGKDLYKQTIVVSSKDTSLRDFRIFLLIIRWDKRMWAINCGQIRINLLCDYGSRS